MESNLTLTAQTLILDISYTPLKRVVWRDAILLVLNRTVEIIEEYPDKYINTPNWSINMPSVVRLLKPIKRHLRIRFSRNNIYIRDRGKCQYCGIRINRREFTYDHVIPRSLGGTSTFENVVCACIKCNQYKGGRTPSSAGMKLLTTPVKPKTLYYTEFDLYYTLDMPYQWQMWLRDRSYWELPLFE
jgi:5-methylcytosine-specific restriction endonuclease McrA